MDRLTKNVGVYGDEVMYTYTEKARYVYNGKKIINVQKLINKLGEFEDFMEEHNIASLADYTKQVRKEVVQEIGRKIAMIANRQPNHDIGFDCKDIQISYLVVASILDQIQGE